MTWCPWCLPLTRRGPAPVHETYTVMDDPTHPGRRVSIRRWQCLRNSDHNGYAMVPA